MGHLPAMAVLIPFIFSGLLFLSGRCRQKYRKTIALLGVLLPFALSLVMLVFLEKAPFTSGKSYLAFPLTFFFRADEFSIFMAVLFSFCYLLATIYSFAYLSESHGQRRYFTLFLSTEGALLGVVLSATLTGLFLFFELMVVLCYLLVIHDENAKAILAGAKYLYMSLAAGLAIFYGLNVTYYLAGRTDFVSGGYLYASPLAASALFAFLLGFAIKAGLFPVHLWLPEAHPAAPAPFSAMLSGCFIKTGVYGLIRVIHDVYGVAVFRALALDQLLLVLAALTIIFGSVRALQQDELKRRLAYSSVAQIGYCLLGIALLNERALFAAIFHIFAHALMKGALFLCAGAIVSQTGKKYVSELSGIGRQMPVVMGAFTLAAASIVGIPPFNAFVSKWHLGLASLEAAQPLLIAVLVISSLLNALYYFPIVINAFFAGPGPYEQKLVKVAVPAKMLWTTALMALLCLGFAYWPAVLAGRIAAAFF